MACGPEGGKGMGKHLEGCGKQAMGWGVTSEDVRPGGTYSPLQTPLMMATQAHPFAKDARHHPIAIGTIAHQTGALGAECIRVSPGEQIHLVPHSLLPSTLCSQSTSNEEGASSLGPSSLSVFLHHMPAAQCSQHKKGGPSLTLGVTCPQWLAFL